MLYIISFKSKEQVFISTANRSTGNKLVSNSNNVSFSVQINNLLISEKTIANCKYNCLSNYDGQIMIQKGLPQLPMITKLIAVPDCDNILISVSPSNEMYLSNYNILPAPLLRSRIYPTAARNLFLFLRKINVFMPQTPIFQEILEK